MQTNEIKPMEIIDIEFSAQDLTDLNEAFKASIRYAKENSSADDINRFQRVYRKVFNQVAAKRFPEVVIPVTSQL